MLEGMRIIFSFLIRILPLALVFSANTYCRVESTAIVARHICLICKIATSWSIIYSWIASLLIFWFHQRNIFTIPFDQEIHLKLALVFACLPWKQEGFKGLILWHVEPKKIRNFYQIFLLNSLTINMFYFKFLGRSFKH